MYYGHTSDTNLSYEYKPEKYVTLDKFHSTEIWGVNTITCKGQAALTSGWTVFGSLAVADGYYVSYGGA